jgi:hypothetical protein
VAGRGGGDGEDLVAFIEVYRRRKNFGKLGLP